MNAAFQLKNMTCSKLLLPTIARRFIQVSCVQCNTDTKTSFSEVLAEKFTKQVNKQRRQYKPEPTRFVQIDALPTTVTVEDVNKLAREAFPKGDKKITEMVFCRNLEFNFRGRCVITMDTPEDAQRLIEYGNRRALGGNILRMGYLGNIKSDANAVMNKYRRSELFSVTNAVNAAGRSVIMSGPPTDTRLGDVLWFLRSKNFHPLDEKLDNIIRLKSKQHASKFLIKFDSESEAWRCVRALHNTNFLSNKTNQNFKLQLNVAY